VKSTKPQAKDKGRRETKHTKKCSPSSVQLDLLWGRDWSLQSTINEFLQRDTNGLQEISDDSSHYVIFSVIFMMFSVHKQA